MYTMEYFDRSKWREAFTRRDWYHELYPEFEELQRTWQSLPLAKQKEVAESAYGFVEELLAGGEIVIGTSGKDWDAERMPVDAIVIHHTKVAPGISWERLDAMHLMRLYAKAYHAPSTEKDISGTPVYSNHFRPDGRQVFYAYHWLVREGGEVERLLGDEEIGWQAGNWDINRRSVAICLDMDIEKRHPPGSALRAIARIIREKYPHVPRARIIGHREANPKTTCPGSEFLSGWRSELLALLD
jgi:hypothetical protein